MLKYRYGFVCALLALIFTPVLVSILSASDPSSQPLIQFSDLTYLGSFRLPDSVMNNDGFTQGGFPIAFNPARNSLFIGSRVGNVAEIAIPALVNSNVITNLNFASFLQGFYEPTEGTLSQLGGSSVASIAGLLVSGDKLYGSASIYYDANNTQRVSHYARSTTLSERSTVGMRQVWTDEHSGFVSGYMSEIPAEWQAKLGGTAITGQCCIPVAWRTSWGPSAFAFNPGDIYSQAKVNATPLLYYSDSHPTLGAWEGSNPTFGATTQINGVAVIAGSRTVLYIGRNGTGPECYGNGTSDQSLVGKLGPDGAKWCYDPTSTSKAQHAYPYNYQIWAYDLNDLAAVKAGTKQPWDVRPYGVWPFSFPFSETQVRIGGVGYDASRQIIYVSQVYADQDGYGYRPIIHALKVGGGAAGAPLPPASTDPLPPVTNSTPSSPTITGLGMNANKVAPQPAGTTITFTATPTGGIAPHEYKWLMHDGVQWTALTGWSTTNSYNWTPSVANGAYRIGVWVRNSGNTADVAQATNSMDFAINGSSTTTTTPPPTTTTPGARLTMVSLSANKAAPQAAGSTITFSAVPNGGTAPQQYKWLMHNGSAWSVIGDWTTSSTFNWTPSAPNNAYRIGVWVRSAGNTVDAGEATNSMDFPINGTAVTTTTPPPTTTTPPPPTTTPGARLTAVGLSANKAAPQPQNTTITFTATPNGGSSPQQYKWLLHNGNAWSVIGDWSTSNTFNWTPVAWNAAYRIGVWVRSAGSTVDAGEATNSMDFPITASTTTTTTPPPTTTTPPPTTTTTSGGQLTAVTLSANKIAPQPQNSTITFTAMPNGGIAPQQYKWLLHDGVQWKVIGDWTTSNTFNWTPVAWNSSYRIGVWVRNAGNTVDMALATNSMDFPIIASGSGSGSTTTTTTTPPPVVSGPLSAVTLSGNKAAPQTAGTTVTFTAMPNGGGSGLQYKYLVHNGAQWTAVTDWSTSNTFNWTPPVANPNYRIGVWVRLAGSTVDAPLVSTSIDFAIR